MQAFFSKRRASFFPNCKKVELEKIEHSAIRLGGVLKIFIKYLIRLQFANKREQRLLYGIRRFGGTSRNEFLILLYLWNSGASVKNLLINRPLCFFIKESVILYEELRGCPLYKKIEKLPFQKILPFIEPVAELAAQLHAKGKKAPFNIGNSFQKEKKKAALFLKEFSRFYPNRKEEIKDLLEKIFFLKNRIIRLHGRSFSLIHNDLTLGNIVFQKETKRLGLIDFSESCTYDPIIDVGIFLSQIDYLGYIKNARPADIQNFKLLFIRKYARKSGIKQMMIKRRVNAYQAWGAIQNAIFTLAPAEKKHNVALAEKFINDAHDYISKS